MFFKKPKVYIGLTGAVTLQKLSYLGKDIQNEILNFSAKLNSILNFIDFGNKVRISHHKHYNYNLVSSGKMSKSE